MSATSAAGTVPGHRHQRAERDRDGIRVATSTRAAAAFYALTRAIAWGWSIALLAAGQTVQRGHLWPTHRSSSVAKRAIAINDKER